MLIRNFRTWWQPPRPLKDREQHRQVTFLELFYDLVYVALIAILAAVVPILLLGLIDIEIIPLLVVINLFMLTPVYFGLKAWVQMRIENQKTGHLSTDAD